MWRFAGIEASHIRPALQIISGYIPHLPSNLWDQRQNNSIEGWVYPFFALWWQIRIVI